MHLSETDKRVLEQLRDGRPHHLPELADELDLAPFEVRACLRVLRRAQLVRACLRHWTESDWILTEHGSRVVSGRIQDLL